MLLRSDEDRPTYEATRAFFDQNPHWPHRKLLQERLEARLPPDLPANEMLALFDAHPPVSGRGLLRWAEALRTRRQDENAGRVARLAWTTSDLSAGDEHRLLQGFPGAVTATDHTERLDRMIWDGHWGSASRQLSRVSTPIRLLGEARIRLAGRQYGVDDAVRRVPESLEKHPGLAFERLRWRRRSRLHEEALQLLATLPEKLGKPSLWWYESNYYIRRLLGEKRFAEAYRLAARHDRFSGADRAEAAWLAGWIALEFLGKAEQALVHFRSMRDTVRLPISVARSEYWSGLAARELQRIPEVVEYMAAAARYPETYYGQYAIRELGIGIDLPPLPRFSAIAFARFEVRELPQIVRMLAEASAEDLARPFVLHLADTARTDEELHMLHAYCVELGTLRLAIRATKRGVQKGRNLPALLFPVPEDNVFPLAKVAGEVPRALAYAVANQESGFDANAVSTAGAQGLMQLMPGTARTYARRFGLPYRKDQLRADRGYNVALGTTVLADLLERFDGSLPMVLAAYNAGSGNVDKWIAKFGDPRRGPIQMYNWIELIPLSETRNYVQRVIEGTRVYRTILQPPPPARSGATAS